LGNGRGRLQVIVERGGIFGERSEFLSANDWKLFSTIPEKDSKREGRKCSAMVWMEVFEGKRTNGKWWMRSGREEKIILWEIRVMKEK
jgi:hypothetical protein